MTNKNWVSKIEQSRLAVQQVLAKTDANGELVKNLLLPKIEGNIEVSPFIINARKPTQTADATKIIKGKAIPETIAGRYKVDRILGVGGMAIVYRVYDKLAAHFKHPSPFVALKMFKEEFANYPDASYLLYSEYALLQSLNHSHIIKAQQFDIDMDSGRAFMTLELLKGLTLDQWLMEYPLGGHFKKIKPMLLEVVDTLCYSHQHHIIHGDLKPSNVMLTQEGCILFDYGLGQALAGELVSLPKISRKRFNAWTPKYAAPELLEDIDLTEKTDIFALSCIVYELLTGKNPYYIDNKTKYSIKPIKPHSLPKKAWRALACGLAIDPEQRNITAAELKESLQAKMFSFFMAD